MAILNITYNGMSADFGQPIDDRSSDADVRRFAVEIVRSGGLRGLCIANLADNAFDYYVVDRFDGPRGQKRIYLRPKVPFGSVHHAVSARQSSGAGLGSPRGVWGDSPTANTGEAGGSRPPGGASRDNVIGRRNEN